MLDNSKSTLSECRACLSNNLHLYLPMGDHAPAQMLLKTADRYKPHPAFPLNTQVCLDCGLIEIADQIPADFFRYYLYIPSGAATMHTHFAKFAEVLTKRADGGLIVDIGCNDGLLLGACNDLGGKTLGIDPAANIAELANKKGVEVFVDYFHPASAQVLLDKYGPAKIICTTNTFNHIGDLHTFMKGVDILLADDGAFVIEVPRAKEMIDNNEFENIYHEHVSEFSLLSMVKLGEFFDLEVTDVTHLPHIHGGSMRVFLTRKSAAFPATAEVSRMLDEELGGGMLSAETYDTLAKRVDAVGKELIALLDKLKAEGKKIVGYGASARGNTLLTYFGIDTKYIDFLVDKNPLKHNMVTPNTRIPIYPVEKLEVEKPDVLFMLAWNFFDEVRAQQSAFEARGGQFLLPLPSPRLVP